MTDGAIWRNEYPCECGAKFIVELPAFTGTSGADAFVMECSFCKRQKSVLLPAREIKYSCVAPGEN